MSLNPSLDADNQTKLAHFEYLCVVSSSFLIENLRDVILEVFLNLREKDDACIFYFHSNLDFPFFILSSH